MARRGKGQQCYVCMASSEARTTDTTWLNIYTDTDSDLGQSLISIIEESTGSVVKPNKDLPQRICPSCLRIAKIAFKFKRRFEQSLQCLREQMKHNETTNSFEVLHVKEVCNSESQKRTFQCSQCSKSFSLRTSLFHHLRTHTGERPFECMHCPMTFSQRGTLNNHIRTHTGERPFNCPDCSKTFSQIINLKNHIRTHTGERPFKCSHCPKSFTQLASRNTHLRSHGLEEPFKCSQCPKTFKYNKSLKNHMRNHTGERPFECSLCSKTFSQNTNLRYHTRTVHQGLNWSKAHTADPSV